jgi:hypothetical protein
MWGSTASKERSELFAGEEKQQRNMQKTRSDELLLLIVLQTAIPVLVHLFRGRHFGNSH